MNLGTAHCPTTWAASEEFCNTAIIDRYQKELSPHTIIVSGDVSIELTQAAWATATAMTSLDYLEDCLRVMRASLLLLLLCIGGRWLGGGCGTGSESRHHLRGLAGHHVACGQ